MTDFPRDRKMKLCPSCTAQSSGSSPLGYRAMKIWKD